MFVPILFIYGYIFSQIIFYSLIEAFYHALYKVYKALGIDSTRNFSLNLIEIIMEQTAYHF